jgi:hypothetical protein
MALLFLAAVFLTDRAIAIGSAIDSLHSFSSQRKSRSSSCGDGGGVMRETGLDVTEPRCKDTSASAAENEDEKQKIRRALHQRENPAPHCVA